MGEILGAQSVFAARLPVCGESFLVIETETKEEEKKNHRNGCSHLKCEESKAERRFFLSLFLSSSFFCVVLIFIVMWP